MAQSWVTPTFNCLIIGNPGTGKTTLMKRLLCQAFDENYQPTTEPVVNIFQFRTARVRDRKRIKFQCYEYPMPDGFTDKFFKEMDCVKMDCAIIMCDITDESSIKHVDEWIDLFLSHGKDIPIAVCGNKFDLWTRAEEPFSYTPKNNESRKVSWSCCSVKDLHGIFVPFCHLAVSLIGQCDLPHAFYSDMTGRGLYNRHL